MSDKVDIDSVKNAVLSKFPLLGVPMSNLKFKEEKRVPTACTDGQTVYYSPDFMNSLSYDEKTFVVAHEVMHVAFDHIKRSKGKNPELWNIATDAVINQILKEQKLKGLESMVDMEDALNKSAEEVYDDLFKEYQQKLSELMQMQQQQQNSQSQQGQNGQQGQSGQQQQQGQGQQQQQGQSGQQQQGQNGQQSQSGQNQQGNQGQQRGGAQQSQSGQQNGQQQSSQQNQQGSQQQGQQGQNSCQNGQCDNPGQNQGGQQGQQNGQQSQSGGQGQGGQSAQQNGQSQQGGQGQGGQSASGQQSQSQQNGQGGQNSQGQGGKSKGRLVLDDEGNLEHSAHDHHQVWEKALERMEKQEKKDAKKNKNGQNDKQNKGDSKSKAEELERKFNELQKQKEEQDARHNQGQEAGQQKDKGQLMQGQAENKQQETKQAETKQPKAADIEKSFADSVKGQKEDGEREQAEDRPEEVLSKEEIEKAFSKANKEKKEEMGRMIRERLATEAKQAGIGGGGRDGTFGEVGKAKAVVDWKKLLRQELEKEEDRWSYRRADAENGYSARIGSFEIDEKAITEVMLDTSGSVNDRMLRNFLRQLKPLLKESKLYVGCFDWDFYGFTEIKTNRDIDTFRIRGGGGTSFDTAAQYFSGKKNVNKIIFTDGCDRFTLRDKKYKDIKWLVFGDYPFTPSLGKVIRVDERKLMQNFEQEMGM